MQFVFLFFAALSFWPGALGAALDEVTPSSQDDLPTCHIAAIHGQIESGETTTLEWTSTNATALYINTIGYVPPNVSSRAIVGPAVSTNFKGTVSNGVRTAVCEYSIGVRQPLAPTCTVTALPNPIYAGYSTSVSWSSAGATSCAGINFETQDRPNGSVKVTPSSSMTYRVMCSGPGGEVECSGNGSKGLGALVSVDPGCAPTSVYSCDGQVIQRTDTTRLCESTVKPVQTCIAPSFCIQGAATCQFKQVQAKIRASEQFLASGEQSMISWTATNATSCSVMGNGDSWEGTSGSELSSPITKPVTYTLECSSPFNSAKDSVTITPLPAR